MSVLVPALTISLSASTTTTTPGSVVGYTIHISNTGDTPYTEALVTDSLDGVLTDADFTNDAAVTAGGGVLADNAPVLSWTGDLPVGASATVTSSITVYNPDNGDKLMRNGVVSPVPGSTCPSNGGATCTTEVRVLIQR